MKTYEITYSNGNDIYSANLVIAESAEQATAYYTAKGREVIGCDETMSRPKPGQPVVTVPEGWTAPAAETEQDTETAAQRDIRLFDFYKRRLLALAGGEPLRWVCVQYLCSFPGLSPYDMGAELMAEGVEIIYDDAAITRAENAAERRRVQRAYAAREGARA